MSVNAKKAPEHAPGVRDSWYLLLKTISLGHRMAPHALPTILGSAAIEAVLPYLYVILPAMILNELVGSKDQNRITQLVFFSVGVGIVGGALRALAARRIEVLNTEMNILLEKEFARTALYMDLEQAESPQAQEYHGDAVEAKAFTPNRLEAQMKLFGELLKTVGQLVIAIILVIQLVQIKPQNGLSGFHAFIDSPYSLLALFGLLLLVIAHNSYNMRRDAEESFAVLPQTLMMVRHLRYCENNLLSQYNFGKDVRLYGLGKLLDHGFTEARENFLRINTELIHKQMRFALANSTATAFFSWLVYTYVALKAAIGSVQIGDALLYIGAINQFQLALGEFVKNIATIRQVAPYSLYYYRYLECPKEKIHGKRPISDISKSSPEFEFVGVSFRYPGQKEYALRDVSLKISASSHIGIVGKNGAGKTTFIKLLCRLYDPTEGVILLNGVDIREYDYEEYLRILSVIFQDFAIFAYPVGQNIAAATEYDASHAWDALEKIGLKDRVLAMPLGLEQHLYKQVNTEGVEISGGEAQKLAIARAFYRDAPVVILDEPTAALDPVSEMEIYANFAKLTGNKTSLYISHRMSSCRMCDEILVFDKGQIIQYGSHDTLLEDHNGVYYSLWMAQAQYYQENTSISSSSLER